MVKIGSRLNRLNRFEGDLKLVYFISDGTAIKIGISNNPNKRLLELQTGNPNELKLIGTSHILVENDLHELFIHRKLRNEWFELCDEIMEFCNKNKTRYYELMQKDKQELIEIILKS